MVRVNESARVSRDPERSHGEAVLVAREREILRLPEYVMKRVSESIVYEREVQGKRVRECVYRGCERERLILMKPVLVPFFPSGEGREKENWEESPRSTDAAQRLRGAHACAGLLPEQANANHPSGE